MEVFKKNSGPLESVVESAVGAAVKKSRQLGEDAKAKFADAQREFAA